MWREVQSEDWPSFSGAGDRGTDMCRPLLLDPEFKESLVESLQEDLRNRHPNLFQVRAEPPGPHFASQLLLDQAQHACRRGELLTAANLCRALIGIVPGHREASSMLKAIKRRFDEASECYRMLAYDKGLDLRQGVRLREQAEGLYPNHPHAYTACTAMEERITAYNRLVREALAAARQGLWETARQRLEAALETLPTAPGLSSALDAVRDVQKAVLFFQRKIQSLAGSNGAARQYEVALARFLEQRARPTVAQIGRTLCTFNP
jgi:tetratricopeptide (TPR) repeat protein